MTTMRPHSIPSAASQLYADAYATHYADGNLLGAFRAYENILSLHPESLEADYARTQLRNIAVLVVSPGELLAAQMEHALGHLQPDDSGSAATGQQ